MKKEYNLKKIRLQMVVFFLIAFMVISSVAHLQLLHHKNEEELKATYTAEATVRRIESQLDQYLAKSDMLKQIIEASYTLDDEQFEKLTEFMIADSLVVEAVELAPGGVVSNVYPLEGNEEASGLDMFTHPERYKYAERSRDSGEYTIAGPFELVQGGAGALLFDPVYRCTADGDKEYWGFVVLVLNWDRFVETLHLDNLEKASYHYQIWKKDLVTNEKVSIAHCQQSELTDALEVACEVPNDTWYFDIEPETGWYPRSQLVIDALLGMFLAGLLTLVFWQFTMQRYRDREYAMQLQKAADEARAANTAKTGFLARMSHDIRTPLNGIIGLLHIDEKYPEDTKRLTKDRQKMLVAANHLLSLINDVLQMSKMESGEVVLAHESMDLNALSADILTILEQRAADAGITLEYDQASEKMPYPYVWGSPIHLRQLFLNVYGNCIKYNRVGGKVTTHFSCLGEKDGVVRYRWIISDTGPGMSKEFLQHIFEPFAQEHSDTGNVYNGTGLGMAIVKALADKMQGTIIVDSTIGKGSVFTIELPFEISQEPLPEKNDETAGKNSIKGLHLLMAEDNELNAEIAKTLLKEEGARVTRVGDGNQAVERFAGAPEGTFDAILMDVMMPVMDGLTATKTIRKLDRPDARTIPIIAMTANAFDEDARKCLAAGMNAHLSKPLQMDRVVATIARYCKKTDQ